MYYLHLFLQGLSNTELSVRTCVGAHPILAYCVLFTVIFLETGVLFCFFLPGDAFLFLLGGLAAQGMLSLSILLPLLIISASLGAWVNYQFGKLGGKLILKRYGLLLSESPAWRHAQKFYQRHGGKALVFSRFFPFLRTFVPFVAGMSAMDEKWFMVQNLLGGSLWIGTLVTLGYVFGEVPFVKSHLPIFVFIGVCSLFIPLLLFIFNKLKALRLPS